MAPAPENCAVRRDPSRKPLSSLPAPFPNDAEEIDFAPPNRLCAMSSLSVGRAAGYRAGSFFALIERKPPPPLGTPTWLAGFAGDFGDFGDFGSSSAGSSPNPPTL